MPSLLGPATKKVFRRAGVRLPTAGSAVPTAATLRAGMQSRGYGYSDRQTGLPRRAAYSPPQRTPSMSMGLASATSAPGGGTYDQAFRDSLARSRASIEQQFQTALSDIGAREGLANQALGLLPGQVQGVYDRGNANLATAQQSLDAAQAASGLRSFMGAGAQMAPISAAIGQDLAARQADVPLLQLGTQQAFANQRGALGQARLGAFGDLDAEERGYNADAAARAEERAFQLSQQGSDVLDRDWLAEREFGRQSRAAQLEGRAARAEEGRALNTFGAADTSAERGAWMRSYDRDSYDRILNSEAYRQAQNQIGKSRQQGFWSQFGPGGEQKKGVDHVAAELESRGLYRTAAVLRYRNKRGKLGRRG